MADSLREQVLHFAARNAVFRAKDISSIGIPRSYLSRLVSEGVLDRRGRGLYALTARDASEQETVLEAAKAVPRGVICLLSALRLHGLTTQNPHEVWIAVRPDQWKPTRTYPPLRIVRMSGAAMTAGVEDKVVDTVRVRAFSPAKTVVDCFRYRNKIGLDVALEALREAWRTKAVSMDELTTFAKRLRMERVMRPYLESLV